MSKDIDSEQTLFVEYARKHKSYEWDLRANQFGTFYSATTRLALDSWRAGRAALAAPQQELIASIANSLADVHCKKCGLEVISTCGRNCPVPNAYTAAPLPAASVLSDVEIIKCLSYKLAQHSGRGEHAYIKCHHWYATADDLVIAGRDLLAKAKILDTGIPASPADSVLSDDEIDIYIDDVLRASGSALRHFSMQKPKDDMRAAMRRALLARLRP